MVSQEIEIPIDVGVYQSDSLPVANQFSTNLIPWQEQTEGGSTRGFLTYGFGIESVVNPDVNVFQGFHVFKGVLYAIIGTTLYRINSDDTATTIGTFTGVTGTNPVIDDNGVTMAILFSGESLWFYDATNGLVQVTDAVVQSYEAETGGIQSLTQVAGFFVYQTKSTMFSGSAATTNMGQDFDALDFVEPFLDDDVVRVINFREELYCFGRNRSKPYGSAVTGSFPFSEIGGAAFDKGLTDRHSVVAFDNSLVFVGGGDGEQASVWRLAGAGSVAKISTPFIDARINDLEASETEINYSASYKFNIDGHFFVGFTVGTFLTGETYFYDATSSAMKGRHIWFRKIGFSGTDWIVRDVAEAYGRFYTGASSLGIGRISKTVYQDYGHDTETDFSGYYFERFGRPVFVDSIELVCESGVGNEWLSTGTTDRNPAVELFISTDRGRTFTSLGTREMGSYQTYAARMRWDQLGMADQGWLFRFKCTAAVKRVFTKLIVKYEEGYN